VDAGVSQWLPALTSIGISTMSNELSHGSTIDGSEENSDRPCRYSLTAVSRVTSGQARLGKHVSLDHLQYFRAP